MYTMRIRTRRGAARRGAARYEERELRPGLRASPGRGPPRVRATAVTTVTSERSRGRGERDNAKPRARQRTAGKRRARTVLAREDRPDSRVLPVTRAGRPAAKRRRRVYASPY